MNIRTILATTALALALPVAASAMTTTVGTSTSVGVSNSSGCLHSWSNSSDSYQSQGVAYSGSAQLVSSAAHVGGASNGVLQGDASLSITETSEHGHDASGQTFNGSASSTTVTTGSSAFNSFSN